MSATPIARSIASPTPALDAAAVARANQTIRDGSKSFAAAARLFAPTVRADAVTLYAWCRHCDDMIDGQELGFVRQDQVSDPEARLAALRSETAAALAGTSADPVFAGFGAVMRRNAIPERYPLSHLDGFAMDVAGHRYENFDDTLRYCDGVAGVVGIMMAYIMGVRDEATLGHARDLGLAFQLTNIARDIVPDAAAGRVYLPEAWLRDAGVPRDALIETRYRPAVADLARRLVTSAEPLYESASIGIGALPFRSAWAVATAQRLYRGIGTNVVRRGAAAWDRRVSTSTSQKLGHVLAGGAAALSIRLRPGRAGLAPA